MKQRIFFFLLLTGMISHAQVVEHPALYFTGELNAGNYFGADVSINYIHKEKYSLKAGYSGNLRQPKSLPMDFSTGLLGALAFGLANPFDQMENLQMAAGKVYKLNQKGTIRVNISLGVGYTTIREPVNWEKSGGSFVTKNYTWDYKKHNTVSLIVNPKIEFPLSRFYGLTISPMAQINKDRIYLGVGLGQMLGLLRKSNKSIAD